MTGGARHLLVGAADGVLRVTINRPRKRNALSRAVLAELRATFTAHRDEQSIKVAVLRGAEDRSFAAGGDLRDLDGVRRLDQATEMARDGKAALDAIRTFPVPVVAALNGDALGGGAELAAACDFRVAARHARIGFVQGRLNIATAWGGGIDLLAIVGPVVALRLLARSELLEAPAALAIGLVDAVAAGAQGIEELAEAFIGPMRGQVPRVLRAFKALAMSARRGLPRGALEALETERFAEAWVHDDHWAAADTLLNPRR